MLTLGRSSILRSIYIGDTKLEYRVLSPRTQKRAYKVRTTLVPAWLSQGTQYFRQNSANTLVSIVETGKITLCMTTCVHFSLYGQHGRGQAALHANHPSRLRETRQDAESCKEQEQNHSWCSRIEYLYGDVCEVLFHVLEVLRRVGVARVREAAETGTIHPNLRNRVVGAVRRVEAA